MNLNNVSPIYSKDDQAIILLNSCPRIPNFVHRIIHQEVMDAIVQYMAHCALPFSDQKINSLGKNYILRVTPCR